MVDLEFYKEKKVLVTGHTGFKGSWLCYILIHAGAKVIGYSLQPPTTPNLFDLCKIEEKMNSIIGDIRDLNKLKEIFKNEKPEIVMHLAAQPIVRESYLNPAYTYETNVMGTVNICECVRLNSCVKSFLNITTDKVYFNNEWEWGYREVDVLDGQDPYSNSKSCSELVTHSYKNSFFKDAFAAVSTVRAGNVIGGGDFAPDRIIPDCIRAAEEKRDIIVRNANAVRPYQHVLEAIFFYLQVVQMQYIDKKYEGCYNVGPNEENCITTAKLVEIFCVNWGNSQKWINKSIENQPHEANCLKLDCSKAKKIFNWRPCWSVETAVKKVVEWSWSYLTGENITECMDRQIKEYIAEQKLMHV